MQVNRNVYVERVPIKTGLDIYRSSQFINPQFPLNSKFDESACLFAQKGNNAPFNATTYYWGQRTGEGEYLHLFDTFNNPSNICPIMLIYGTTYSGNSMWDNLWGYEAKEKKITGGCYPIIAFDYNKICLYPQIYCYDPAGNRYILDIPDFLKSNVYRLSGIAYGIYYGNKNSRTELPIHIMPSINYYKSKLGYKEGALVPTYIDNYKEILTYYYNTLCAPLVGCTLSINVASLKSDKLNFWHGKVDDFDYIRSAIYDVYPIYNYTEEDIYTQLAYLGLPFALTKTALQDDLGVNCVNDDIFYPVINSDGTLEGKYVKGKDVQKTDQATKWDTPDSPYNDGGYKGENRTDPNQYTNKINLSKPNLTPLGAFNRSFAITANNCNDLANFLWNADESVFNAIVDGLKLMGGNPIDGIINLRLYPFDISKKIGSTGVDHIIIGRTDTQITGIKLPSDTNSIIDLGYCKFFEYYGNFLDYEPYTTAQLYVPYVGVIPVSANEFIGHTISVKMIVDYVTGSCTAIIFRDDIPYIYKNGIIGIDIAISGNNATQYATSIINGAVNTVEHMTTGALSANPLSIAGGVIEGITNNNIKNVMYQNAGSSSPSVSTWQPQKCYFIVSNPITNYPLDYGHNIGYACSKSGRLGDFQGFTVCQNPEISINGTEQEKEKIKNLLNSGVYI